MRMIRGFKSMGDVGAEWGGVHGIVREYSLK